MKTRLAAITDSLATLPPMTLEQIAAVDPVTAEFLQRQLTELGCTLTPDTTITIVAP